MNAADSNGEVAGSGRVTTDPCDGTASHPTPLRRPPLHGYDRRDAAAARAPLGAAPPESRRLRRIQPNQRTRNPSASSTPARSPVSRARIGSIVLKNSSLPSSWLAWQKSASILVER